MLTKILKKVRRLEIFSKNKITSVFSGNYRSAFKGRGIEFADIRPYDSGDDVRDIDWKTTSKQGEMYVKTYHESRDNTLFFVIDGGASLQFSSQPEKKYEMLLETFALLAFAAVQNGDRVGIIFDGTHKQKIFPPKKGRRNVLQILSFLIEEYEHFTFSPNTEIKEKKNVFQTTFSFLKHSSTLFFLTGDIKLSAKEKKYIKILRKKHDCIPIIFQDPMENNFSEEGEFIFQDSTTGKISSLVITPQVQKNFQKIRAVHRKKLLDFFQKNKMRSLWIDNSQKIFRELLLFFQH